MEHPCGFCGGAAHPATGCVYSVTFISCWRCTIEAWRWVKSHTNSKSRRMRSGVVPTLSFYEAAGKSYDEIHGGRPSGEGAGL
jgi:hypothetical protein